MSLALTINNLITFTPLQLVSIKSELEKHHDYLELLFNPNYSFGVSHKSLANLAASNEFRRVPDKDFYLAFCQLNKSLTASPKETALKLVNQYGAYAYFIFKRKLGGSIGLKTINKIHLIHKEQTVMKYTDLDFQKLQHQNYYLTTKYDGNFVILTENLIYTRGLKVLPPLELQPMLDNLKGKVLFAEAIVNKGKLGDRYELAGLLTQIRTKTKTDWNGITFKAFDCITAEQWQNQQEQETEDYDTRFSSLTKVISTDLAAYKDIIQLVPHHIILGSEHDEILHKTAKLTSQGYEGVVLTPSSSKYTFKRNKQCMRYKEAKTADLRVTGFNYGSKGSKYEHLVGSLICEGFINNTKVTVNLSGFDEHQRSLDYYSTHFHNQIVEVLYNEVKDNTLILARFNRIREVGETDEYN